MVEKVFDTGRRPQWCPGCGNFSVLTAVKAAFTDLALDPSEIVAVAGIGCHGRMTEYLNVNAFHAIHGRAIPVAVGVKTVNPNLTVIVHTGDGDAYSIGLSHLLHAARRNVGIKVVVHNNMVFALTTGQAGPTTPKGVKTRSTPAGNYEEPFNTILLALASGATFVARGFSDDVQHLKELIKLAIKHRGFAFIDVLQPCPTFYDVRQILKQKVYKLEKHDVTDFKAALELALESERIPVGVFYHVEKPAYEENFRSAIKRLSSVKEFSKIRLSKLLVRFS